MSQPSSCECFVESEGHTTHSEKNLTHNSCKEMLCFAWWNAHIHFSFPSLCPAFSLSHTFPSAISIRILLPFLSSFGVESDSSFFITVTYYCLIFHSDAECIQLQQNLCAFCLWVVLFRLFYLRKVAVSPMLHCSIYCSVLPYCTDPAEWAAMCLLQEKLYS